MPLFGNPAIRRLSDPWLCVPASRLVCYFGEGVSKIWDNWLQSNQGAIESVRQLLFSNFLISNDKEDLQLEKQQITRGNKAQSCTSLASDLASIFARFR